MEWTRRVIPAETLAWLAALPPTPRRGRLHHGPRQPPRSDLGVHPEHRRRRREPRVMRHALGPVRAHPPAVGLPGRSAALDPAGPSGQVRSDPGGRARTSSLGLANRLACQPGQRRPAARRQSCLQRPHPGHRHGRVSWLRTAYDIAATQAAMRSAGLPSARRRAPGPGLLRWAIPSGSLGRRRQSRRRTGEDRRNHDPQDDRRTAPSAGAQTRRPPRSGRTPARPLLPVHRPRISSWPSRPRASRSTPAGRFASRVRSVIFGRPLASEEEIGERLPKVKALAIFSSDAISSSAYATEEILRVLIVAAPPGRWPTRSACRSRSS